MSSYAAAPDCPLCNGTGMIWVPDSASTTACPCTLGHEVWPLDEGFA